VSNIISTLQWDFSIMKKSEYYTIYTNGLAFIGVLLMITGIEPILGAYIALFGVGMFFIQVAQISLKIPLSMKG
jgi:hypothetical protein